jgi:transcriptional regulator with XRE-family HTH domain
MFNILNNKILGECVRAHRDHQGHTQNELIKLIGGKVNRSHLAHLEQGRRIPSNEILTMICSTLNIPKPFWEPFTKGRSRSRFDFEAELSELVGIQISMRNTDEAVIEVVENLIHEMFSTNLSSQQAYHSLLRILVFYDVPNMSRDFFDRYITAEAFKSISAFGKSVKNYHKDAIRLFSSLEEAYLELNKEKDLDRALQPLKHRTDESYRLRSEFEGLNIIPDEKLPYLGYIAASRVKEENNERESLSKFLLDIAKKKKSNSFNVSEYSEKTIRKYDSLLRKFNSKIEYGLFSPLFSPSPELLEREAKFILPESGTDLEEMANTQKQAYENLSHYLSADFMDVYVATSMRNDADFVSVNNFVKNLFDHEDIRPLKLRYFNPTQSWIEDRIAKGLVEALMLKRADYCIYMAQKDDTFGKDSEASVSLGQGKPVIVYVPKLFIADTLIDSERIGKLSKEELLSEIEKYEEEFVKEVDENIDLESLMGKLLTLQLEALNDDQLCIAAQRHWADYDLYGEVERRISDQKERTKFIAWMDKVIKSGKNQPINNDIKENLISMFVAMTIRYERRAKIFREVHPLALQVILSTGVLNGILVTRSVESSAQILKTLILNNLQLDLEIDENNYRLVETTTRSTIRVISRHNLLSNAFSAFYRKPI